jgi:hypothetical protein
MNWDVLLHWMTHLGEGSWEAFQDAVTRLAPEDADSNDLVVALRFHLSDLAHVDFFTGGSRRWRVLRPVLAGLAQSGAAILCGGRTPRLHEALARASHDAGCAMSLEGSDRRPTILRITGATSALREIAAEVGVGFFYRFSQTLSAELQPLFKVFEDLPVETAPTNWSVKSFDFGSMTVVDGLRRNSACEYSPRHGIPRWYVHTRRGRLKLMPKREAIYAAAMLQGISLLSYDPTARRLFAPAKAPPPESYSRVACLCSGHRPVFKGGLLIFEDVPPSVGTVLCVTAGQPEPVAAKENNVWAASERSEQPV